MRSLRNRTAIVFILALSGASLAHAAKSEQTLDDIRAAQKAAQKQQ